MQHLLITKEHYHLLRAVFYLINSLIFFNSRNNLFTYMISVTQINSTTIAVQDFFFIPIREYQLGYFFYF